MQVVRISSSCTPWRALHHLEVQSNPQTGEASGGPIFAVNLKNSSGTPANLIRRLELVDPVARYSQSFILLSGH